MGARRSSSPTAAPVLVAPVDCGGEHAAAEVHSRVDAGAVRIVDRRPAGDVWRQGGGGDPSLVGQVAEVLALRMLDPHKKVQILLCLAMGVSAEAAGDHPTPYLEPIYEIFVQALHKYGTRSRSVLFDTMGIMAENVGEGVGRGSLPGLYIPPLLQLWNSTGINNPFDRTLLPLME
jgi:hypothetical protein